MAKVVEHLESVHPYLSCEPLSIKGKRLFQDVYRDDTEKIPPAKEGAFDAEGILDGHFKHDAPYTDPYEMEESLTSQLPVDCNDLGFMSRHLPSLSRRHGGDISDPIMYLRLLDHSQDGSLTKLMLAKEIIEKTLEKLPGSCRLAHQGLHTLKSGCEMIRRDSDRLECCISGLFSFILRLMRIERKSFTLQCIGLECFFHLIGGFGIDSSLLHLCTSEKKPEIVSDGTKSIIVTTLCSMASGPDNACLKVLVDGIECVAEYYYTRLTHIQKR